MSDYRKGQLQEKLNTLTAEKNVLDWKASHPKKPTIEDFETQQRYYEREIQKVQDDMVNGLGNGSLKVGSDDWYALHNKADNLEQQIKAYNRGMMGVLDGEKAVPKSEQAQNQPGINNANSTVRREQIHPGINNANSTVGREQIQPGINNPNSMIGDGGNVLEGLTTDELNYEKQADVDSFIQENNEARQTDKEQLKEEIISDHMALYNEAMIAVKYGDFSKLNNLKTFIYKGENVGSIHYEQLEKDLIAYALEAENYEQLCKDIDMQYDKIEDEEITKINNEYAPYFERRATLDRVGELDENPEFTLVDWHSEDFDMNVRMQGYENERIRLLTEYGQKEAELYKSSESLSHKEWLELNSELINKMDAIKDRLNEIDKLMEDTKIALNGNVEDMNLTQLTIRAEHEFIDMLKNLEQDVTKEGLEWFDGALKEWIGGDDSAIRSIVTEVYGGTKHLENVNLDDLRKDYVKYAWESGLYDEIITERASKFICEEITPYFKEKANYEETENGYKFEMPPNLVEYALDYIEAEEQAKKDKGLAITIGGIALGALAGLITLTLPAIIVGGVISTGSAIWGSAESNQQDEWDDIAGALRNHSDTDKTLIIEVVFNPDGDPEASATEKEE